MADLFAAGLIDAHRMMEFDRLCVNDQPAPQLHTAAGAPAIAVSQNAPTAALSQSSLASPEQPATPNPGTSLQTAAALRALRLREGVNVADFAHYLGVQPQAVVAWEAGFLRPSAAVARLLEIVAEKGLSAIH
jgi:DNA-binding transcriptional regulator YiaG